MAMFILTSRSPCRSALADGWTGLTRRCGGRTTSGSGRRARSDGLGAEAAAILGGADLERAQERAAHRLGGAETAGRGDRRDRIRGLLQSPAGGLQAHVPDIASRRGPGLGSARAATKTGAPGGG